MKARIVIIIIILILGVMLFSCAMNRTDQVDNVDVDTLRTEAVETFASSLTETLIAGPTTSPTLTVEASVTPSPNIIDTLETPAKADPCYNLLWLKDITIPDGTQLKANEVFTKTWLVQNNGGCAWPPGFTFSHVGGDLMRGQTVILEEPIPVGAKRQLSIQLVVPSDQNGLIQSSWRMADADGNYFGNTLSVNILVGEFATPTVTNTP
jgi:hypothetical protein